MNTQRIAIIALTFILLPFSFVTTAESQERKDPTADSDVIEKTLSKIRDVERLDAFLEQNKVLTAANKALLAELASIKVQIAKLNKDMTEQTAKLRRQLLQMPTFEVQSKILGGARNMALLKSKDKVIRIRDKTVMSVAVTDGVWVLMQVENISIDMIQLYFPELDRRVYLYD
ncbi:MAG: hypothetical protein ACI87E_001936 [Mariniblastus sp.]|jgi:hypothetical protein